MRVLALLRRCSQCSAPHGFALRAGITKESASGQLPSATPNDFVLMLRYRAWRSDMPHQFQIPPWPTQKGTDFVNRIMWAQSPPEDPFQHTLHSVTAAFFVVNEALPGQNRLREPFNSCARQRAESAVRKTALPSASLGRTSIFSSDTREPAVLAWFGTKTRPGQHRGIRPFSLVCSLTVERRAHNPEGAGAMPAGPTISKIAL